MFRLVLVLVLMLLPLQWSDAAAAWWGEPQVVATADADPHPPSGLAEGESACSADWPLEDPMGPGTPLAEPPPTHAASPRFEHEVPIDSHIPAGPERPDRPRAA